MGWKTGSRRGQGVGWTPEQVRRHATRTTLTMAQKSFEVMNTSHEQFRGACPVKIVDRRASRGKILVTFGGAGLEANAIIRREHTVTIQRNDQWMGSRHFCWYIVVAAVLFDEMLAKAGVSAEALHGWQAGPPRGDLPPADPPPNELRVPHHVI